MRVRHYENGSDSDLEIYDTTPRDSKYGRILNYAISSVTKCQGRSTQWTDVPKPIDHASVIAVGNSNSWKLSRWVNYSVD